MGEGLLRALSNWSHAVAVTLPIKLRRSTRVWQFDITGLKTPIDRR